MKKNYIIFVLIGIITLTAVFFWVKREERVTTQYLRIHVRADSNEQKDQNVKYKVKDDLVKFLTPYIAEFNSYEQALTRLENLVPLMQMVANQTLTKSGFTYESKVEIKREYFPTRVYDGKELPQGYYDSIIVSLGSGKGDNWWCVVYPPLCFVDKAPVQYRSKILEIIRRAK